MPTRFRHAALGVPESVWSRLRAGLLVFGWLQAA